MHDMEDRDFFSKRCVESIYAQSFKDYEIVITNKGTFAENVNQAIKEADGDIIHIMCMDDYFFDNNSLQRIADEWPFTWLVSGCMNDNGKEISNEHYPVYNKEIYIGKNTIGPPSVLSFENLEPLLFDENLKWLVDCDYYTRLHKRYGLPKIMNEVNIIQGIGSHQATHSIKDKTKTDEFQYMIKKYGA